MAASHSARALISFYHAQSNCVTDYCLVSVDPAVLPGFKTHTINSQKEMDKVTGKDKIHRSKYCCDNEDPENRKDEHETLSWGSQPQWTIHRELHTAGLCIQLVCWFHLLPLDSCCPTLSLCIINYCCHWKLATVTSNQHIASCLHITSYQLLTGG